MGGAGPRTVCLGPTTREQEGLLSVGVQCQRPSAKTCAIYSERGWIFFLFGLGPMTVNGCSLQAVKLFMSLAVG